MAAPKFHFLNALSFVDVSFDLIEGVKVFKVESKGKSTPASFRITEEKFTLLVETIDSAKSSFTIFSSKPQKQIRPVDVGEIDRIQRGQATHQFEKAKKSVGKHRRTSSGSSISSLKKVELQRNNSVEGVSATASAIQLLDPHRSFSIIFRGAHTLDLMATTHQERNMICDALDNILQAYQRSKTRVANDVLLLRYVWLNVDKKRTGYVNLNDVGQICAQVNFYLKPKDLQTNYEKFGKVLGLDRGQRRKGLTFEQSAAFLHYLKRNSWVLKPVTVLWNELFGELMNNGKRRETVSEKSFLELFLQGKQQERETTIVDVRILFRKLQELELAHSSSLTKCPPDRITKDMFEAFLLARDNDAFDPRKETFNAKDMNQPLSEYWINSSHNTYLIGDQYTSQSSVEMYSNALYRGCRCLELDIWDGPKEQGRPVPVVWHGHTMTSKIFFKDIIKCIKVFLNFHPDSFPIILSFENHCSIPYQEVMVEDLLRILGDALYIPSEASLVGSLPSPAELRGMVVIKGKRPTGTNVEQPYDTDDDESDDDNGPTSSMGDRITAEQEQLPKKAPNTHGISPQLARLTLFHGSKCKTFEESNAKPSYWMHSFTENRVRSRCRHGEAAGWTVYNQTHMSRTYPAGSRVDSSNYNPLLAWSVGCQMVSLNFQTEDAFLRLNDGRFRENGNCGYVLKPSTLMIRNKGSARAPVRLAIRVLSGSCLPKPKGLRTGECINPYVKVAVFDVKDKTKEHALSYPTGAAGMNGFFPIWGQEKFTFSVENGPVAMVQFTVMDKTKEEFIASASIPLSCLRRGIRSVKLYDVTNTQSGAFDFACLLVDIKIGQSAAEI